MKPRQPETQEEWDELFEDSERENLAFFARQGVLMVVTDDEAMAQILAE